MVGLLATGRQPGTFSENSYGKSYEKIIKTVNRQDRIDIVTKDKTKKYYMLNGTNQQQFEINGPAKVRAFSRLKFDNKSMTDDYYMFVREDGIDLGTYYHRVHKDHL